MQIKSKCQYGTLSFSVKLSYHHAETFEMLTHLMLFAIVNLRNIIINLKIEKKLEKNIEKIQTGDHVSNQNCILPTIIILFSKLPRIHYRVDS